MKDKTTAGILGIVFGGLGAHQFYLGRVGLGFLYLFFSWTFIPGLIGFVEGITLLTMNQDRFDAKHNPQKQLQNPQNIVVNVAANASNAGGTGGGGSVVSVAAEIKALHELKLAGALTDEEFQQQKRLLLGGGQSQKQIASSAAQVIKAGDGQMVSLDKG